MIVRLMGEGQYRVDEETAKSLNELDERAGAAAEKGDEDELRRVLAEMGSMLRDRGERLEDADLSASDAIVPPEDLSLDEVRELLTGEGLIPDLPAA